MAWANELFWVLTPQPVPTFLSNAISEFLTSNPADFNFLLDIKQGDSSNPFGTATCE